MSSSDPAGLSSGVYEDDTQRRQRPSFKELRRPGYLLQWLWGFLEGWFRSRSYQQLAIGLPFLLIAVGGPLFVWWLKSAPRDSLVAAYEAAVDKSVEQNEPEKTGLYLEGLVRLRELRKDYRHRLVMHYVQQEQPEKAAAHVSRLVGADGYVPTRLWLLDQAVGEDPIYPLSEEDTDRQLNAVLSKEPTNLMANWQMANRLIAKKQFKTAEDHLFKIIEYIPELGLLLAKVQIQLQRDREQILSHLNMADESFQKSLLANNKDVESRTRRAEVMLLKNDPEGARELIAEGRLLDDNDALRVAESKLLAAEAQRQLIDSNLNATAAAENLAQAMQLDPNDSSLLRSALSLDQLGVKWTASQLRPAVDALAEQPELSNGDRQLLLAALSLTGQNQRALDLVADISEASIADRILKAQLLLQVEDQAEADTLFAQLLDETKEKEDLTVCLNRVRILLSMNRSQEAYELIEESQDRFPAASGKDESAWQSVFAAANFRVFQSRLKNDEFENAEEAIAMLTDSRQGPVAITMIVPRMIAVINVRPDFEPAVREKLIQFARGSRAGWQIYNMLGTYDLQKSEQEPKRLRNALTSLQLAYQSQKNDPMIMNNLVIALVRNQRDLKLARQLVEKAMSKLSNPVDALSTRAEISVAEGLWEDALIDLEAALRERPNSANVRRLLVQVLTELDQPDLAEEHQAVYDQLTAAVAKAQ